MEAKIENIARRVVKEEIPNCRQGIENNSKLDDHERRIENMDLSFTDGLKDLKTSIEKKETRKENHLWDIVLVIMNAAVLIFIAMKIH
jgi:hypothetical protein